MTWHGTGADAARHLADELLDARREAAEAWAERDRWREEAERLAAELGALRSDVDLALWAAGALDLDGAELSAVLGATLDARSGGGAL